MPNVIYVSWGGINVNLKEVEYALEDLEALLEWVNKDCSIAGFLDLVASANTIRIVLEKEIPLKPLVDDEYGYFICGNCKGRVTAIGDYEDHQYCLKCGQRLDWEE